MKLTIETTEINYLNVLMNGYKDVNTRKFFDQYLFRQSILAKENNYNNDEFFEGCLIEVESMINEIERKKKQRILQLGLVITATADELNKQTNELKWRFWKDKLTDSENELNNISIDNFPINLIHYSMGRFTGALYLNDLEYIKSCIDLAHNKTS